MSIFRIDDPREPRRVAHPLPEVLLLVVYGTVCDCDHYDLITDWCAAHLDFLSRYLPYHHGVPGCRWLTMLNRIDPELFADAFTSGTPDLARRLRRYSTGRPEDAVTPLHPISTLPHVAARA